MSGTLKGGNVFIGLRENVPKCMLTGCKGDAAYIVKLLIPTKGVLPGYQYKDAKTEVTLGHGNGICERCRPHINTHVLLGAHNGYDVFKALRAYLLNQGLVATDKASEVEYRLTSIKVERDLIRQFSPALIGEK